MKPFAVCHDCRLRSILVPLPTRIVYRYQFDRAPWLDGAPVDSEVGAGGAIGLRLFKRKFVIGPETNVTMVISKSDAAFTRRAAPSEIILGAHYEPDDYHYGLGAGPELSRGFGAPELRILASVE
jgi:hypothetical protein